jgi:hypothetical protein
MYEWAKLEIYVKLTKLNMLMFYKRTDLTSKRNEIFVQDFPIFAAELVSQI